MATQIRGANNGAGVSQIAAASISNADIHASAAIALSKLAEAVIQADGGQAFTADQSMGGFKLTNVASPTTGTDAANKSYVDGIAAGLDYKEAVRVATTAVLAGTMIANNGTPATGERTYNTTSKTITWFATEGPTTIDGVTLSNGMRILVKNETSTSGPSAGEGRQYNGIYVRTSLDVWTRATDMDGTPTNEISTGNAMFVISGTANASTGWLLSTTNASDPDNINVDTETKNFVRYNAAASYTASNGITQVGNDFQLNLTGLTTAAIAAADELVFADASDSNNEKKITFANFESSLTLDNIGGTLSVTKGGTGAITFTSNGVLYGNGTSAIQATSAGASGSILYSNAGTPAFTTNLKILTDNTLQLNANASSLDIRTQNATAANSSTINVITGDTITSGNTGSLVFNSGAPAGNGTSGAISAITGATSGSGASGLLNFETGEAFGSAGSGGITIHSGHADAGGSGTLTINSGNAITSGNSGSLLIRSGDAPGDSGNVTLQTGNGTTNDGLIRFNIGGANLISTISGTGLNLTSGNTFQINTQTVVTNASLNGGIMIGSSGGGYTHAQITAGSGISITNGAGSITIAISGSTLTTSDVIMGEVPSGTVNGSNTAFTLANTPAVGIALYLNGLRQKGGGVDYTISGANITMTNAPQTGDLLLADYFL